MHFCYPMMPATP